MGAIGVPQSRRRLYALLTSALVLTSIGAHAQRRAWPRRLPDAGVRRAGRRVSGSGYGVLAWGSNYENQLGSLDAGTINPNPTAVTALPAVDSVNGSYALTAGGGLWRF